MFFVKRRLVLRSYEPSEVLARVIRHYIGKPYREIRDIAARDEHLRHAFAW
jgi:hypothetical protein